MNQLIRNNDIIPRRLTLKSVIYLAFLLILTVLLLLGVFTRTTVYRGKEYHSKNKVALYLYCYHNLPKNYTLKANRKNTENEYIGGDIFYYSGEICNYTQIKNLRECDVDYPNSHDRNRNRLVYSADYTEIYYTPDHYKTFQKITKFSINAFSNWCFIIFAVFFIGGSTYVVYFVKVRKDSDFIYDAKAAIRRYRSIVITVIAIPPYLIYLLIKKNILKSNEIKKPNN